jgi:phenylalanyl-tRNA synthetase alpha chain
LLTLEKLGGRSPVDQIVNDSGLAHAAVMRAALSLFKTGLLRIHKRKQTTIVLSREGREHAEKGLPERRLMHALVKLGREATVEEVLRGTALERKLTTIALGWLHRKNWVTTKGKMLKISKEPPMDADEKLLAVLQKKSPRLIGSLNEEMKNAANTLKKRKLVLIDEKTLRELELTKAGRELVKRGIRAVEEVSQLTPELVLSRNWQKTKFRKFDVTAPGPVVHPGKIHPVQEVAQLVREAFLEMGFTEIRGPIVQTAFWNFDALFQPQDHPAREMMDTFYLAQPKEGRLPRKSFVEATAKTHENGWTTGSRGWQYKWSPREAKKLVMRTHTTPVTIHYLAEHRTPPVKAFSVDRIYRNEKLDDKHLAEFFQIEGIIMEKNVTLRDLIGTLKEFYHKLGLKRVEFWPSYFPYTEPSAQATAYVPELKTWIELCGMGIFRPEVVKPFGIKHPVLAWGGGLERLAMLKLGVNDIRLLYKNDLGWIRRSPICQ